MSTDITPANPGETLELEINLDGIEDVETLKAKVKEEREARIKEAEARRQLTARAKAAEDKVKSLTPDPINKQEPTKPYSILDDEAAGLILEGYKPDEVRFILQNGGRKVLDDKTSFVTIAVEAKREQRKAEQAAAQTEGASGTSDILKKYTTEQLKNMSAKELEKLLPKTY